jgi:hypothetical protein
MYFFLLFFLFIFLGISIIAAILMLSLLVGLVQTRGVPFISTAAKDFDKILSVMQLKAGDKLYDLGCGKAHFLIYAASKCDICGVGYELSFWPYLWARFNVWISGAKVKIYLKNFLTADLSDADMVFCYLFPEAMVKLEDKFQQELKIGAMVVSNSFPLPQLKPAKTLDKILVYRF